LAINCTPGPANSFLINIDKDVPTIPANNAKIMYKIPISFALDDQNHLSNHIERPEPNLKKQIRTAILVNIK